MKCQDYLLKASLTLCAGVPLVLTGGCKSPDERVKDEHMEAAKEIGKAERNVAETEHEAAKNIADAKTQEELDERKVEATKDIADANKELQDEKAEATKEVAEAEATAGHGGTYTKE